MSTGVERINNIKIKITTIKESLKCDEDTMFTMEIYNHFKNLYESISMIDESFTQPYDDFNGLIEIMMRKLLHEIENFQETSLIKDKIMLDCAMTTLSTVCDLCDGSTVFVSTIIDNHSLIMTFKKIFDALSKRSKPSSIEEQFLEIIIFIYWNILKSGMTCDLDVTLNIEHCFDNPNVNNQIKLASALCLSSISRLSDKIVGDVLLYLKELTKDGSPESIYGFSKTEIMLGLGNNISGAVHHAATNGQVDTLQWLMDHNFDMETVMNDGSRAVHLAAINGHVNILQWLLDHSFDMEAVDIEGSKAVHIAAQNGHLDIIEWLTEYKFNLEEENNDGSRAVHYAAYNGHIDILQWLMNHDCDTEAMNNNGSRAVHYAGDNGHKNILKWFKDNNCDMSPRTNVNMSSFDPVRQPSIYRSHLLKTGESVKHAFERIGRDKSAKGYHLGAGELGTVSRYTDKKVDIAIKKICNDYADNEIAVFEMLPPHPRILKYLGARRYNSDTYIFMEPMSGGSLKDYLDEHGPLDSGIIAHFTKPILEGLDFLHSNKIIHRNIKCSNILRDTQNNIKICGFGISRYPKSIESKTSDHMLSPCDDNDGGYMSDTEYGTPYWKAPEVIRGDPYSTGADVWSLGATVVEMLTGKHPYPDLSPEVAMMRIGNRYSLEYTPPKPISAEFQEFIDRMIVRYPQQRDTVKELLKSNFILAAKNQTN